MAEVICHCWVEAEKEKTLLALTKRTTGKKQQRRNENIEGLVGEVVGAQEEREKSKKIETVSDSRKGHEKQGIIDRQRFR